MNINEWLKLTTQYIPSRKERAAVRKELLDHYTDRFEAFRSTGMRYEDATRQAVAAMGDPDDTGRLLRRIHKPWLTWALRFTRIALVLLVLFALGFFGTVRDAIKARLEDRQLRDPTCIHSDFDFSDGAEGTVSVVSYGTAEGRGWFGRYPITVSDAWVRWLRYRIDDPYPIPKVSSTYNEDQCAVFLDIQAPFWIDPDVQTILEHLSITDSRGASLNFICSKAYQTAAACSFYIQIFEFDPLNELRIRCDTGHIFFDYQVRFEGREDLDGWFTEPAPENEADLLETMGPPRIEDFGKSISNYTFTVLDSLACTSEPVRAGSLVLSAPWTLVRRVERLPKANLEDEEPIQFSAIDFVLKLEGPWQELFLTENDLLPHLTMLDNLGNELTVYEKYDFSKHPATVFADRGYYRFETTVVDGPERAAWYELTLTLGEEAVTLRLTPTGGE